MSGISKQTKYGFFKCFFVAMLCIAFLIALSACNEKETVEKEVLYPLEGLTALNGEWNISDAVSVEGKGDMFALSQTEVNDFVFCADVEFDGSKGAASLVFGSSDNPSLGSYIANVDMGMGNARIFKFESTGQATTKGEYRLSDEEKNKSKFNLKVESAGGYVVYFLDEKPVVKIYDPTPMPGKKLGLLDYDAKLSFSNIGYREIKLSDVELDELTGNGIDFSGQSFLKTKVAFETNMLSLNAVSDGNIGARLCGGTGAETVTISNGKTEIKGISDTSLSLVLEIRRGDFMRSYVIDIEVEPDPESVYNEPLRPQFHFTALKNWINDPNGLVYDPSDESWHLFYQYNPYGLNIANQVWGHAVSKDLVNWKELDIAIDQDSLGAVFSGSAVVDEDNTSGFFTNNKPGESKLVALFTSDGGDRTHGTEKQCIAYSKDHGVTWIRPSLKKDGFENPVIPNDDNAYGFDFRDPKIFRYDGKWFMAIAGGRARLFTSDDLINWTSVCDMGFDSECPDFYPLAVDGDENNIKWVYTASGKWYVIGRLEKRGEYDYRFVEEGSRTKYNGGNEMYATQSYFNDGTGKNRRIAISWIQDDSASSVPNKGWNGLQSLPLEQGLVTVNGNIVLTSYPVEEIDSLRKEKVIDKTNSTVSEINEKLKDFTSVLYDMVLTFKATDRDRLTLTLRSDGQNHTDVIYDAEQNLLKVVRSQSTPYTGNIPKSDMEMPLYPDSDGNVTIRVLMDTSVIEVFGNGGQAACCGSVFPGVECVGSSVQATDGVTIEKFEVFEMASIWH